MVTKGEVSSLYLVVAFLSVKALVLSCEGSGTEPKKCLWVWLVSLKGCSLCFLYPTCRALGVPHCFLVCSPKVLLAWSSIFLDRIFLLWVAFLLACCISTTASKGWVHGIVIAIAIGVSNPVFCHRKSRCWWDRKNKGWGRWKDSMIW
jgi:hypothetical protein